MGRPKKEASESHIDTALIPAASALSPRNPLELRNSTIMAKTIAMGFITSATTYFFTESKSASILLALMLACFANNFLNILEHRRKLDIPYPMLPSALSKQSVTTSQQWRKSTGTHPAEKAADELSQPNFSM